MGVDANIQTNWVFAAFLSAGYAAVWAADDAGAVAVGVVLTESEGGEGPEDEGGDFDHYD